MFGPETDFYGKVAGITGGACGGLMKIVAANAEYFLLLGGRPIKR
jgi:hypothetical protein